MKRYDQLRWKPFRISTLFTDRRGDQGNMSSLSVGVTPLVSAKNDNNGYKAFVSAASEVYPGHCITLNNDGDGGVGYAYYQPHEMFVDAHVYALYPVLPMSKYTMIFIAKAMSKQRPLFGHSHGISLTRLHGLSIMLPVNDEDSPDYPFMDEYMRSLEQRMLDKYRKYIDHAGRTGSIARPAPCRDWRPYRIDRIFTIGSGKRLVKSDMTVGKRPFIGATDSDNGITAFCGNSNTSEDCNVLGVNYNGSVCESFYHPYKAIFSDDVKRFHLREVADNKYVFLFIKSCILRQKSKFEYGYKFNGDRMAHTRILLPSTADGSPDYAYMEKYMQAVEWEMTARYADRILNK